MSDIKIHIKAKKVVINEQGNVKLTKEAVEVVADIATKTGIPVKHIVSEIIVQAQQKGLIVLDREVETDGLIVFDKEH